MYEKYILLILSIAMPLLGMDYLIAPVLSEETTSLEKNEKVALPDDSRNTFVCFKQFGIYNNCNLDRVQKKLATKEGRLSSILLKSNHPHKQQNLVIGKLTFVVQNERSGKMWNLSVPLKPIFESRLDYEKCPTLKPDDDLFPNERVFENQVLTLNLLFDYIMKILPANQKNKRIEEIVKIHKVLQRRTSNLLEMMKKLTSQLDDIGVEDELQEDPLEKLRKMLFDKEEKGKNEKFSSILAKLATLSSRGEITTAESLEKNVRTKIFNFYKDFWHAELRLIYHILYNEMIADSVRVNLSAGDKIVGIFVHLHSRYNFCNTCQEALVYAIPLLKEHFKNELRTVLDRENIFLKLLSSFRIHYASKEDNDTTISGSAPFRILNADLTVATTGNTGKNNLFLKREALNLEDEFDNSIRWLQNQGNNKALQKMYDAIYDIAHEAERGELSEQ